MNASDFRFVYLAFKNQIIHPYALTVAGVAFVSFILAGLIQNVVICLIIAIALMIATLLVIKAIVAKKHAGIFQEMAEANKILADQ